MTVRLLDVDILVSILDSAHVHHDAAMTWFRAVAVSEGWATCPLTENGLIRVVSHLSYPNLRLSTAHAAESLPRLEFHESGRAGIRLYWEVLSAERSPTSELREIAVELPA